jgi:hypothetical protein
MYQINYDSDDCGGGCSGDDNDHDDDKGMQSYMRHCSKLYIKP